MKILSMNYYQSILRLTIIALSLCNCPLSASDLEDILESNEIKKYEQNKFEESLRAKDTKPDSWLPKDKNFSLLFTETNEQVSYINLWFDLPSGEYTNIKASGGVIENAKLSTRTYRAKNKNEFGVDVLVPHPRQQDAAKYLLLKDFAKYYPPKLKIEFAEDILIQNRPAKLFTLPDGICHINIQLAKATLVVFKGKCSSTTQLNNFAQSFSFDRFEEKLNS